MAAAAGERSIGIVADSNECVYGPDTTGRDDTDQLELATLSWVHWFNEQRLHGYLGDISPAEYEAAHYAAQQTYPIGVGNQ